MSDLPAVHEQQRSCHGQQRYGALHLSRAATAAATAHLLSSSTFSLEVASQRSNDQWHLAGGESSLHAASAAAFPPSQGSNPAVPLSPPESASCPSSRRPSGCGLAAFPGIHQMQLDGATKRLQGCRVGEQGGAMSAPSSAASGQGQHLGQLSAAALRAGLTQRCGANAATAAWVSAATQEQLVDLAGDYLRSCGSGGGAGGCPAGQSEDAAQLAAVLQSLQQRGTVDEAAAAAAAALAAASGGSTAAAAAAQDSIRQAAAAQVAHLRTGSRGSCRGVSRAGRGCSGASDDPRRYLWDSTDKPPPLDLMMDSPSTEVSLKASEGPLSTHHALSAAPGASPDGCALLPTMSGGTMWDIHPDSLTSGYTPRAAAAHARAAHLDASTAAGGSMPVDICMTGDGSVMGGVEEVMAALQQPEPCKLRSSMASPMQLDNVVAMCGIQECPTSGVVLEGALDALHTGGPEGQGLNAMFPRVE